MVCFRTRFFLLAVVAFSLLAVPKADAALRPATATDCITLTAAGSACTAGSTVVGPHEEAILHLSLGENSPLAFLRKNAVPGANTKCIDPEFAKKLKSFMEATYAATGHMPQISEDGGWRSAVNQNRAAAAGNSSVRAGGSPHNYGLAADFNNAPTHVVRWMRDNVSNTRDRSRSGFGLQTIGNQRDGCGLSFGCDGKHFELVNWQAHAGSTGGCTDPGNDGLGAPGPAQSGGGMFSNLAANLFKPQPQMPPSAMPSQPLPQASSQPLTNAFQEQPKPSEKDPPAAISTTGGTVTTSAAPGTATQILEGIISGSGASTTITVGSTTRPLTESELATLRDGKTSISYADERTKGSAPTSGSAPLAPTVSATFESPEGIAIAVVDRGENVTEEQRLRTIYSQMIRRISLAIDEVTRILRGEPRPTPEQRRKWFLEEEGGIVQQHA